MTSPPTLYELLQVHSAAEREVIRAAYLCLAKQHHPDEGGTAERMAALNEAWTVLGDAGRRAAYDASRAMPPAPARAGSEDAASGAAMPPARANERTLDFGRYAGRTLEALARDDPDYLAWLARSPGGRQYRREIDALLSRPDPYMPRVTQPPPHRGGWRLPWHGRPTG